MRESILPQHIIESSGTDWILIALLIMFALLAMIRMVNPGYLQRLIPAFTSFHESNRLQTAKSARSQRAALLMNLIALQSLALFATFQWMYLFQTPFHPLLIYLLALGLLTLFLLLRLGIQTGMGYLFMQTEISRKMNQLFLIHVQILGSLFMVFNVLIAYAPDGFRMPILFFSYGTLLFWEVYNAFRLFQFLAQFRVFIFYRILYLCAFEILPWWWIIQSIMAGWKD